MFLSLKYKYDFRYTNVYQITNKYNIFVNLSFPCDERLLHLLNPKKKITIIDNSLI